MKNSKKFSLQLAVFLLLAHCCVQAQTSTRTITYSDSVKDYGPIIQQTLQDLINSGGGTLKINYGIYPLLTPVTILNKGKVPKIAITGVKSKSGKLPVFTDTTSTKNPHHFFNFTGNAADPSMILSMSNIEIIGNNVPYSPTHPFFGKENYTYFIAIAGVNIRSFTISNVIIRNFYGRGIYLANFFDRKYNRMKRLESPVVRNCKILNVWGYSKKDDSGDALEFISANNPLVENNIFLNNLAETKYVGRCGIVLEHNTEKAIIRNNVIGGYSRNIHAECDWGGHLIEGNTFTQSTIAVTLSEDCNQPSNLAKEFSPIIIKNNNMVYKQELKKYGIPHGNYSFISVHRPNPMLNGLQVLNNKMSYTIDSKLDQTRTVKKVLEKKENLYIELQGQPGAIVKGNKLQ